MTSGLKGNECSMGDAQMAPKVLISPPGGAETGGKRRPLEKQAPEGGRYMLRTE